MKISIPKGVKDFTNQRHNFLVIVKFAGLNARRSVWLAQCDCGKTILICSSNIKKQKSCGCKSAESVSASNSTHRMSKHPVYKSWCKMLERCTNKNHKYWQNYGGRGVRVCARWLKFENFLEDMGASYKEGLSLDRIDNDKGYNKTNCRWANHTDQARNRRSNVWVDTPKGKMLLCDAEKEFCLNRATIQYRRRKGLTGENLFAPPNNKVKCK